MIWPAFGSTGTRVPSWRSNTLRVSRRTEASGAIMRSGLSSVSMAPSEWILSLKYASPATAGGFFTWNVPRKFFQMRRYA